MPKDFKPEQLLDPIKVNPDRFARAQGRYVIPYSLTQKPDKAALENLPKKEAAALDAGQHEAMKDIIAKIESRINVRIVQVDESRADSKQAYMHLMQGDLSDPRPTAKKQGETVNYLNIDRKVIILDNDDISQKRSQEPGYWKEGGNGWAILAHEMLHGLGLTDADKVTAAGTLTTDTSLMAYAPGTDKSARIREMDWQALESIYGAAPARDAPALPKDDKPVSANGKPAGDLTDFIIPIVTFVASLLGLKAMGHGGMMSLLGAGALAAIVTGVQAASGTGMFAAAPRRPDDMLKSPEASASLAPVRAPARDPQALQAALDKAGNAPSPSVSGVTRPETPTIKNPGPARGYAP
jgi:hypothetical protein